MEKTQKKIFDNKILLFVTIAFVITPLLINAGLVVTDIICEKTGFTLTARGLNNGEWLDFWKQYLTIAISFMGICLVYISSNKDREKNLQEKNAQQYLEKVWKEENTLVEVTQSFNTGVVYDVLLQQPKTDIYEGRKMLADARTNMDYAHIKFELLTDLCDDFKKCEGCFSSPCADKKVMIELRDLFYDMEGHYFSMLDAGECILERLNQEQGRMKMLDIEMQKQCNMERIIELQQHRGLGEEINASEAELQCVKEKINELEKSKLELNELNRLVERIQKEMECISKDMRPRFIRHCKVYIDMKKAHATELRTTGHIKYKKVDEETTTFVI